jgi:hypothetical protein
MVKRVAARCGAASLTSVVTSTSVARAPSI